MRQKIERIKLRIRSNKTIINNFSYLSALQIFNILFPFITYPYLMRILGASIYGSVIFAQVIVIYFGIIIDFGFKASAAKDISLYRDDRIKLSEIISSIYIIKFFLWIISLIILIISIYLIPSLYNQKALYLFSFTICFNELLFPQWYFQGLEKMKFITIINLTTRLIFVILIFIFVKQDSDYLYVPVLNGLGAFIGGIIGLYIIFKLHQIKFIIPSQKKLWFYLKQSFPLFGSNAIISIKDKFNLIFIGSSLGMKEVAIYDLATKIMSLFMQPIDIVNNTIFPKVAKENNTQLMIKASKIIFFLTLILVTIIQPFLHPIINFLGRGLLEAITPTRILLITPLIFVWSLGIAQNIIVAKGYYSLLLKGMFFTTMFYLLLILIGYILNFTNTVYFFIFVVLIVYIFELLYRLFLIKKHSLT